VPKSLHGTQAAAQRALKERRLPLVLVAKELDLCSWPDFQNFDAPLVCDDFLQAQLCLGAGRVGAILPSCLVSAPGRFWQLPADELHLPTFSWHLAWNPRLLRLNPHAIRRRDFLENALAERLRR